MGSKHWSICVEVLVSRMWLKSHSVGDFCRLPLSHVNMLNLLPGFTAVVATLIRVTKTSATFMPLISHALVSYINTTAAILRNQLHCLYLCLYLPCSVFLFLYPAQQSKKFAYCTIINVKSEEYV